MKNLCLLREEAGLSQQKLADRVETTQQSIHKYETGISEPDIGMLIKLADVFNTTVDYLIGYSNVREKHIEIEGLTLDKRQARHLADYINLPGKYQTVVDVLVKELTAAE